MRDSSLISFVARSKRRLEILKLLEESEKAQVELMKRTKMYKGHTSRTLGELSDKKLILCTNPDDRYFRSYKITKKGKRILEEVKRLIEG